MATRTLACLLGAFLAAPVALATAQREVTLHVNDSASLRRADVRCVARQPNALTCGGARSRVYVRVDRRKVRVFRAAGANAVFHLLYEVSR